jgi:hypothetical protein
MARDHADAHRSITTTRSLVRSTSAAAPPAAMTRLSRAAAGSTADDVAERPSRHHRSHGPRMRPGPTRIAPQGRSRWRRAPDRSGATSLVIHGAARRCRQCPHRPTCGCRGRGCPVRQHRPSAAESPSQQSCPMPFRVCGHTPFVRCRRVF